VTINGSQAKTVAAWNFLLPIVANDYVQLMWRTNDTDTRILYQTSSASPARPEIPSVILTIQQV